MMCVIAVSYQVIEYNKVIGRQENELMRHAETAGRIKGKHGDGRDGDVGKTLAGYKKGRPLPVLPRIRPRLPRGTQRVPHDGMPSQTLTSTRAIRVTCGDRPIQ